MSETCGYNRLADGELGYYTIAEVLSCSSLAELQLFLDREDIRHVQLWGVVHMCDTYSSDMRPSYM